MRVLLVCGAWEDDPWARGLARSLAAAGERLSVLALDPRGGRGLTRGLAQPGHDVDFLGAASTVDDARRAVEALLAESRVDLAHLLCLEGPLAEVAAALDRAAVPLVHGASGRGSALELPLPPAQARRLCGRFARVLAPDEDSARRFLEAGVDPLRLGRGGGGPSPWALAPPGFDDGLQPILQTWGEVLEERAPRALPPKDRLVAVVVHERGLSQTLAAVQALEAGARKPDAVVVADASAFDGASAFLRAALPGAEVLELDGPRGYAAAANAGLARAKALGADWILVCGGETELCPTALARLCGALARAPELGVVGPRVRQKAAPGAVLSEGLSWSPRSGRVTARGRGVSAAAAPQWELQQADGLCNHALLIRRRALDAVGSFDASGAAAFLALDFCLRARGQGFGVACLPSAEALHAPVEEEKGALRRLLHARAQLQLAQAHAPRGPLPSAVRGAAIAASHAAEALERRAPPRARRLLAGARTLVRSLRAPAA